MSSLRGSDKRSAGLQLRKKKQTMAEIVNQQMTEEMTTGADRRAGGGGGGGYDPFLEEHDGAGGTAEEFEWGADDNNGGEDDGEDYGNSSSSGNKKSLKRDRAAAAADDKRLRRRGPLDAALSEGRYAAAPVKNVESLMDDIFGDLDMGDIDAEGEEVFGRYGDDDDDEEDDEDEEYDDDDDDDDDERGAAARRGKQRKPPAKGPKKAKDLTEEEYAAFLEGKRKRRRTTAPTLSSGLSLGEVSGEEGDILAQLEGLRQAQMGLVGTASSSPSTIPGAAAGDAALAAADAALRTRTQEAVRHYIMLHSQLLRVRVQLQPAVIKAVSFPQFYAKSLFTVEQEEDEETGYGQPEEVAEAYEDVEAELMEVLAELYGLTPAGAAAAAAAMQSKKASSKKKAIQSKKTKASSGDDGDEDKDEIPKHLPTFAELQKYHTTIVKKQADACLGYWGGKLVQANSARLKSIAQPLPDQIAAIIANMPRLRRKVQKNRAHLPILAHPAHELAAAAAARANPHTIVAVTSDAVVSNGLTSSCLGGAMIGAAESRMGEADPVARARQSEAALRRATSLADGDVDEEILDDSDFLRELVRRGGAVAHRLEQQLADVNRETLPAREAGRKGFHRITKGKEVNYEPRPKLVGFLMSEGFEGSDRNDVVLKSLFQ